MSGLLRDFLEFNDLNHLFEAKTPTLLAVSGGIDSVAMAHLFAEAGAVFSIAHCNFQLRGAESDGDAAFVQALADQLHAPYFERRFDTAAYAGEHGLSLQMAARTLRYHWFEQVRETQGCACVATAHHLNDSVETALFNFARGTGLAGLTGIPLRNGNVVRPLLFAERGEIETYVHEKNIAWREDSSNAGDDYTRNFVRHHILPRLLELNPALLKTVGRTLQRLEDTEANFNWLLHQFFSRKTDRESVFEIEIKRLLQLPAPRQALSLVLKPYGFTEDQARQVFEHLDLPGLELQSAFAYRLLVDRAHIFLRTAQAPTGELVIVHEDDLMVRLPDGGRLFWMPADPVAPFPDGKTAVLVDADRLQFPIRLRPWRSGDVFQPLGMAGQKQKLQDFFTNIKLSRFEKEKVWILENADGAVIWVIGHRPDERFKIVAGTKKALKISWIA